MFEGCIQVASVLTTSKNIKEEKIDFHDANALLILFLSYLLPKIKLRPLRRLLTRHKIIFSSEYGLACLRRKLKTFIRTLKKGKYLLEKKKDELTMEREKNEQRTWY